MKKVVLTDDMKNRSFTSWRKNQLSSYILTESDKYKEYLDFCNVAAKKIKDIIIDEHLDEETKYIYENFPSMLKMSNYIALDGEELGVFPGKEYSQEGWGGSVYTNIKLEAELPNDGSYTFCIEKEVFDKLSEKSRNVVLDLIYGIVTKNYEAVKQLWNGKTHILSGITTLGQLYRLNEGWYEYLVKKEWGESYLKYEIIDEEAETTDKKPDRNLVIANNMIKNQAILEELKNRLDI